MNAQQKGIVTLIKSALDGKEYPLPDEFDFKEAVKVALEHRIIALIYYGALNCGINKNCEDMQKLFRYIVAIMCVGEQQNYMINRVFNAFDEKRIDYLPMKGLLLKEMYPKPEMRIMGDADVLIREDQYDQIQQIMHSLGFTFCYESNHELVWKYNKLVLELHKRVMTTYNKDFYEYFGNGWRFARKVSEEGTRYETSDEDFYIYMFVHFTKHYRVSGIGIKHLVDIWVYRKAKQNLDDAYVEVELKKLKLDIFHKNIMQTVQMWFADGQSNDKTDYITDVIFTSGEYGVAETAQAAHILRESKTTGSILRVKVRKLWEIIFLPYSGMCRKYAVLKKMPFLLPGFWVVRWVDALLHKRPQLRKCLSGFKKINDNRIEKHQQALNFVGLDFYTQEQE